MSQWTDRWDKKKASLGNKIISTHLGKRFMQNITVAERGYGKSTYHIQTIAYVGYHLLELSETEAWNYALDNLIYRPSQLLKRVEENDDDDTVSPVFCLDDAAVHFSNKLWWSDWSEAILMDGIFDLIRPVLSCLLINCPDKSRLLGSLQNYLGYEETIYIDRMGGYQRDITGIHWYRQPSGRKKWRKVWEDNYSCYIPVWVFNKYMDIRKNFSKVIRDKLKDLHDKKQGSS